MAPREDLILFLDLETTGSDRNNDEIIEFGGVMLDAEGEFFPEIGHYSHVIVPSMFAQKRMVSKEVVRQMHEKNGLLYAIEVENRASTLSNIERDIIQWIDSFVNGDDTHIPYGGSGTGHFDGPFLEVHMPTLRKRLTYWTYDVGSMRRQFELAGVPGLDQETGKTHRALDDARFHTQEFRYYQKLIRGE